MDDVRTATVTHRVTDDDTAAALGSGDLAVLGTPRLLAWCEEATCAALDLDAERSSVGTRIDLEHLAPSPVGTDVTCTATPVHADGRLHRFQVVAQDEDGTLLASGEVRRLVVDRERFWARVAPARESPVEDCGVTSSEEDPMSKTGRKRRARRKKNANHGKRPNT